MTTSTFDNLPGVSSLKPKEDDAPRSLTQMALRRFRGNKTAIAALVVVLLVLFTALFTDFISPYSPTKQNNALQDDRPSQAHLMGTDDLGRDIFSRLLFGTRVSLTVGVLVEVVVILIGVPIGLIAGFFGGLVDTLLMRFTDIMFAFPGLLLVIILGTAFGRSIWMIIFAFAIASWPVMTRLVRGQVLQVRQMDYVLGARSIGASSAGMMIRHIVPNVLGPIIVVATLDIPGNIIGEATLTFLGLGVNPSTPTWGIMVSTGYPNVFSRPTEVLFPSLAIAALTLAFALFGDGVRDAFDPRTK